MLFLSRCLNLFKSLCCTMFSIELAWCNCCLFNGWGIEFQARSCQPQVIRTVSKRERDREREQGKGRKYWKINECIFILPCECPYIYFKCDTWESFWQPCQNPEVLHLSGAGWQSLSPSIITEGLCSPSLLYMQNSDYWTGHKLCYFLHLTKNCSFVERWFERPTIT